MTAGRFLGGVEASISKTFRYGRKKLCAVGPYENAPVHIRLWTSSDDSFGGSRPVSWGCRSLDIEHLSEWKKKSAGHAVGPCENAPVLTRLWRRGRRQLRRQQAGFLGASKPRYRPPRSWPLRKCPGTHPVVEERATTASEAADRFLGDVEVLISPAAHWDPAKMPRYSPGCGGEATTASAAAGRFLGGVEVSISPAAHWDPTKMPRYVPGCGGATTTVSAASIRFLRGRPQNS